jgi:uncharacterized protein (DUF305 family)
MKLLARALPAALALALAAPVSMAQQGAQNGMMPMMQKSMKDMMSMPMSGKPDVDFAMAMREHHKAAIDMAQWELKNGKDAKMREMAQQIIDAQKKEMAELSAFLDKNGHSSMGESSGGAARKSHSK